MPALRLNFSGCAVSDNRSIVTAGALGAELERVPYTESLLYQLPGGLFSIVTNTLYIREPHFRLDPSGRCGAASSTMRCSPRNQTH